MNCWYLSKMKRKAQAKGETLLHCREDFEVSHPKHKWAVRSLIRLDRIICGCKPFVKRQGNIHEICNDYFGLEIRK